MRQIVFLIILFTFNVLNSNAQAIWGSSTSNGSIGHYNVITFSAPQIDNMVKIKTTIPAHYGDDNSYNVYPTIYIKGADANTNETIDLQIFFYYTPIDRFYNSKISSSGSYRPDVYLDDDNGFIVIYLDGYLVAPRFEITAFSKNSGGVQDDPASWYTGWQVFDEAYNYNDDYDPYLLPYYNRFGAVSSDYLYTSSLYSNWISSNSVTANTGVFNTSLRTNSGIFSGNNPGIMFWNTNNSNDFQMGLASGPGAYNKFAQSGDFVMSKVNTYGHFFIGNSMGGDILFTTGSSGWGSSQKVMTIFNNGKVGIGTTAPITGDYKLVVEGNMGAKKIKVTQLGWADYVFAPEYKLLPLQDLETYIKQYQHLPDVPSASEVAANGIDLGDNQAVLLKKIEELTLYLIEQQKQIQQLNEKLNKVEINSHKPM